MTAMAYEPTATDRQNLLNDFLGMETPRGFRAELIEGQIVVSPPTDGDHEDYLDLINDQVKAASATRMQISGGKGLVLPGADPGLTNRVIPDATMAPWALRLFRGAPPWMPPDGVALVVEVTSSNAERDRIAKRHCYARAALPLYLLVDRETSTVTLFSDPEGDDYRESHSIPFGKPLPLPAPFSFTLETGDFL